MGFFLFVVVVDIFVVRITTIIGAATKMGERNSHAKLLIFDIYQKLKHPMKYLNRSKGVYLII